MNHTFRTLLALSTCLFIAMLASSLWAENAPMLLNFQGRLTNSVGSPVTGMLTVRFTLIQDDGMTDLTVYEEDASITPDSNGVFAHVIGTGTPVGGTAFEESDFNTLGAALYVELSIGAETLSPRTRILSSAFAIEASRLDGKSANEIIGAAGGNAFVNEVIRQGAKTIWISDTQVRLTPGVLGFSDAKVRKTTNDLTWDSANGNGPLGLDVGTIAADTWYYLYAIPDPGDDNTFTLVASVESPNQVGGSGPSGYPVHRFVGSVVTAGTGNVTEFYRSGADVFYRGRSMNWLAGGGAQPAINTWVTIDASVRVPETAEAVMLNGYYDAWGGAAIRFRVAPLPNSSYTFFCADWVARMTPTRGKKTRTVVELAMPATRRPILTGMSWRTPSITARTMQTQGRKISMAMESGICATRIR